MDFYETIKNYPKQFEYHPEIIGKLYRSFKYFVVCGMGGSHLAVDILKNLYSNIFVHKNYGLPNLPKEILKNSLIITISHSGNTEETIDSFMTALKNKLSILAISTNGKLIKLSKKYKIPYIEIPGKEIQPRLALGYHLKAILKVVDPKISINFLSYTLNVENLEREGREIVEKIRNKVPIIYSSEKNEFLAYNFKIKFNETSKIPAFHNVFPELNHNEMEGILNSSLKFSFVFLFIKDNLDDKKNQKRITLMKKFLNENNFEVLEINLKSYSVKGISNFQNRFHQIFSVLILGDFISYFLGKFYRKPPESIFIEKFKNML